MKKNLSDSWKMTKAEYVEALEALHELLPDLIAYAKEEAERFEEWAKDEMGRDVSKYAQVEKEHALKLHIAYSLLWCGDIEPIALLELLTFYEKARHCRNGKHAQYHAWCDLTDAQKESLIDTHLDQKQEEVATRIDVKMKKASKRA